MISPDEIRAKVKRLYPRAVQAWLQADSQFFPCRLPCNLETSPDVVQRIREVEQNRQGSAEVQGQGYRIQWELIHSRTQGTIRFPVAIYLD
ncbi:MAG TPA: hypothetical protein DCF63_14040, partial [Planctomycetaceae bacterium]|nr:hypothetical protein [Planctomycetaceae bacterium]